MEDKSMVIAVLWVPKGAAKKIPKEYDLDEQEIEEIKQELQKQKEGKDIEEDDDQEVVPGFSEASNKKDMEYIENNLQNDFVSIEEFSEEEKEDYTIKKSDAVIVGAKIEKGYSCLEICIYEEQKCNLFQHHEIGLNAFPLCLEWLPVNPKSFGEQQAKSGNYAIVGTFLPEIEIWDLDVVNNVMPKMTLGGMVDQQQPQNKKKKLKNKKGQQVLSEGSHSDAVITLSLNQFRKNILCSGSADQTIKLWDISNQKCEHTYTNHSDKIQCVKWNNKSEAQLASAGFDRMLQVFDVRYKNPAVKIALDADPEAMIWCPFDENQLIITEEDGKVCGFDLRNTTEPLFQSIAHAKSASSVTASAIIPGLMATTGLDGMIRVWDYQTIVNGQAKMIAFRSVAKQAQKLYCGQFYCDSPFLVGCGTNAGEILIWDTSENVGVANHFLNRTPENYKQDVITYLESLKEQKMEMENN